jgi:hypothetical protein
MMTFEWVVSNRLRNILLSSEVSTKNLSWALDKTYDAIRADENNEMVSYEVLGYRERSYTIAEHYFEKGNLNRCLKFIKNTWRV